MGKHLRQPPAAAAGIRHAEIRRTVSPAVMEAAASGRIDARLKTIALLPSGSGHRTGGIAYRYGNLIAGISALRPIRRADRIYRTDPPGDRWGLCSRRDPAWTGKYYYNDKG